MSTTPDDKADKAQVRDDSLRIRYAVNNGTACAYVWRGNETVDRHRRFTWKEIFDMEYCALALGGDDSPMGWIVSPASPAHPHYWGWVVPAKGKWPAIQITVVDTLDIITGYFALFGMVYSTDLLETYDEKDRVPDLGRLLDAFKPSDIPETLKSQIVKERKHREADVAGVGGINPVGRLDLWTECD